MLSSDARTALGAALTEVILVTFRANGLLLGAGDVLAAGEGLTSARWQVLGAIVLAERPLTVPQIARRMGLTRQSVHASVGQLTAGGLVEVTPNADHRRSGLVRLTERGRANYAAVDRLQREWVNRLAEGFDAESLATTRHVLDELCHKLSAAGGTALPEETRR